MTVLKCWWKEEGLALRRGGGWFADDLYLCAHGGSVARLYEYAERGRGVVETLRRIARRTLAGQLVAESI